MDLSDDDAPEVAELGAYTGGERTGGAFTGAGDTSGESRSLEQQEPNVKIGDVFSGGDTEESQRGVRPLNIFRKKRRHHHKKSSTKGAVCPKREGEELMCRDAKTLGSCYHMSYTCHILVSGACVCTANKM
jgi:hypothetical protein